jgi:hypothetical protein
LKSLLLLAALAGAVVLQPVAAPAGVVMPELRTCPTEAPSPVPYGSAHGSKTQGGAKKHTYGCSQRGSSYTVFRDGKPWATVTVSRGKVTVGDPNGAPSVITVVPKR